MSKQKIIIYTQATKWHSSENFEISHSTFEYQSDEYKLAFTINVQEVEIEAIDVDKNKLTEAHIHHLKNLKQQVKAEAEVKLNSLDEQISTLLCLDNKEAA